MKNELSSLSNEALIAHLMDAVSREDSAVLEQIFALVEVRSRRVHLEQGHSDLFAYCMNQLGFDRSRAYRRSTCANLACRFPLAHELLRSKKLSPSALVALNIVLKDADDVEGVLRRAVGMSKEEAHRLASELNPVPESRASIQVAYVLRPPTST